MPGARIEKTVVFLMGVSAMGSGMFAVLAEVLKPESEAQSEGIAWCLRYAAVLSGALLIALGVYMIMRIGKVK